MKDKEKIRWKRFPRKRNSLPSERVGPWPTHLFTSKRWATSHEGQEKNKVEEVPKKKNFSAIREDRSMASPPLHFEAPAVEKLMAASIAATKGAQKRLTVVEP